MRIVVLCPHFAPDTAPTGTVMTRIVAELATHGHELHVVTSLPWYQHHRVDPEWAGGWVRRERTAWGTITRVHPFPGDDKSNLPRRAWGFVAFTGLSLLAALRAGGWFRKTDVVVAMSPPLTLGLAGWIAGIVRRGRLVFNVQDIFPDAAVRTGAISNRYVIAAAAAVERFTYRRAAAVTVLSDDLRDNVVAKLSAHEADRVHVIPNFVDTDVIRPGARMTAYRAELGFDDRPLVLYAGNVGFSQSLDLVVVAARACPDLAFVVNGDGAARADLERRARGVPNLRFVGFQPAARLPEVLASGDIHVVPLRAGLGDVSVPSKTYSSLAAGRPVIAAIDEGTEIPRLLTTAGAGLSVAPDAPDAFVAAIRALADDPQRREQLGHAGRVWVVDHASPQAVGAAYAALVASVRAT